VCDLGHADVGIGRSIALAASMSSSVSFGGRPPVRPNAPRSGEARIGAPPDPPRLSNHARRAHRRGPGPRDRRLTANPSVCAGFTATSLWVNRAALQFHCDERSSVLEISWQWNYRGLGAGGIFQPSALEIPH
jgi:hypothetical protein